MKPHLQNKDKLLCTARFFTSHFLPTSWIPSFSIAPTGPVLYLALHKHSSQFTLHFNCCSFCSTFIHPVTLPVISWNAAQMTLPLAGSQLSRQTQCLSPLYSHTLGSISMVTALLWPFRHGSLYVCIFCAVVISLKAGIRLCSFGYLHLTCTVPRTQ